MPQPTKGEKKECNCGQALHIRETYMHLEGCPLLNHPSPSSGMKWEKEFIGKFCTPDKDFTPYMIQVAEANKRMIPFISQAISEAKEETRKECYTDLRKGLMSLDEARADERRKVGEKIRNIVTENAGDCSAIVYKVMDFLTKEK